MTLPALSSLLSENAQSFRKGSGVLHAPYAVLDLEPKIRLSKQGTSLLSQVSPLGLTKLQIPSVSPVVGVAVFIVQVRPAAEAEE